MYKRLLKVAWWIIKRAFKLLGILFVLNVLSMFLPFNLHGSFNSKRTKFGIGNGRTFFDFYDDNDNLVGQFNIFNIPRKGSEINIIQYIEKKHTPKEPSQGIEDIATSEVNK